MTLVPEEIDRYARRGLSMFEPDVVGVLAELEQVAREETGDHAQMLSGPVVGGFLAMLVRAIGARRVLEIGTFVGYSAMCMAAALPEDGELITCDIDADFTAIARRFWQRTRYGSRITLRLAPALDTIAAMRGPFDLVFIDADKEQYGAYYDRALELLDSRGMLVLDNALRSGRVLEPENAGDVAIAELNQRIRRDPNVQNVLLTVRDGLMMVMKR